MAAGTNGSIVIEGLGELTAEQAREKLASMMVEKAKSDKAVARQEKQRKAKLDRLIALATGTQDEKLNPKGHHNPAIFPETLRPAFDGEQINGSDAKGWVVTVRCQHLVEVPVLDDDGEPTGETTLEICGDDRLVNTQDAFQVRFCEEHKAEAAKAKARERRQSKKAEVVVELVSELTDEQVAEQLAAFAAQVA